MGFRVSRFHGFRVSGFKVSGFLVSCVSRFHPNLQIGIGIAIGIDCRAHEAARNDECKGGGGPEPDSDGTVMEPRNV